jgi:hypothetical protein
MKPWAAEKHSAGAVNLFFVGLSLFPGSEFVGSASGAKIRLTRNSFARK